MSASPLQIFRVILAWGRFAARIEARGSFHASSFVMLREG
jgi:hypothetical protein